MARFFIFTEKISVTMKRQAEPKPPPHAPYPFFMT